jgi:hypothetical protein
MSDDANEALRNLHTEIANDLLRRVKTGDATAQELAVAIKFLANNHIEAVTKPGSKLDQLHKSLPVFDDDAEEQVSH